MRQVMLHRRFIVQSAFDSIVDDVHCEGDSRVECFDVENISLLEVLFQCVGLVAVDVSFVARQMFEHGLECSEPSLHLCFGLSVIRRCVVELRDARDRKTRSVVEINSSEKPLSVLAPVVFAVVDHHCFGDRRDVDFFVIIVSGECLQLRTKDAVAECQGDRRRVWPP